MLNEGSTVLCATELGDREAVEEFKTNIQSKMKNRLDIQQNNRRDQLEQRRNLRSNGTPAEAAMWNILKGKKIMGLQWRRQFSIGPYILDFYCPKIHLCIELDGEPHYTLKGMEQDQIRTEWLQEEHGIHILRFENHLVFDYPQNVVAEIELAIKELGYYNEGAFDKCLPTPPSLCDTPS